LAKTRVITLYVFLTVILTISFIAKLFFKAKKSIFRQKIIKSNMAAKIQNGGPSTPMHYTATPDQNMAASSQTSTN